MNASAFAYARADSVDGALEMLSVHREKAKLLSDGQSLLPAMSLRLVCPEMVIDIGQLAELKGIAVSGGVLSVGALTRHLKLERSREIAAHAPAEAAAPGAAAAVINAANDVVQPVGGTIVTEIPLAPQVILTALGLSEGKGVS